MYNKNIENLFIPDNLRTFGEIVEYFRHVFAYKFLEKYITENDELLEVGYGSGVGANYISSFVKKVTALDVNNELFEFTKKKFNRGNCEFSIYNGINFPFPDKSFNTIIMFQVIEHIKNDEEIIANIKGLLKENGQLVISTPNRKNRVKEGKKPWYRYHVREYDAIEFRNLLSKYFEDVTLYGVDAKAKIKKYEMERIKKAQFVDNIDFLRLRNLVPKKMIPFIINLIRKTLINETSYSVDQFHKDFKKAYFLTEDYDNSLDLIAICK